MERRHVLGGRQPSAGIELAQRARQPAQVAASGARTQRSGRQPRPVEIEHRHLDHAAHGREEVRQVQVGVRHARAVHRGDDLPGAARERAATRAVVRLSQRLQQRDRPGDLRRDDGAAIQAYDGSAQGGKKIAFGNTWAIAAIVVKLPFCSSPVALPVLFRLWRGKGTPSQVELAAEMVKILAGAFGGRAVHGVGDAAFHGKPLVIEGTTWTTRLPASAVLYGPRPPRTGKRGRPRVKGARLGKPAQIAAGATWQEVTVTCYGATTAMQASVTAALWHGSFGTAPGRLVLVKEPGSARPHDLAIFTLDTAASPEAIIERYAWRWPIEPSNAAGKQIMGVGDACNRVTAAVERTVPFGFLVQSLLICWYARYAYDPADVARRRMLCPWYTTKTEPSTADMLARLRREFPAARFPAIRPGRGCRVTTEYGERSGIWTHRLLYGCLSPRRGVSAAGSGGACLASCSADGARARSFASVIVMVSAGRAWMILMSLREPAVWQTPDVVAAGR